MTSSSKTKDHSAGTSIASCWCRNRLFGRGLVRHRAVRRISSTTARSIAHHGPKWSMRAPKCCSRAQPRLRKPMSVKVPLAAVSPTMPVERFKRWLGAARRAGEPCPQATALATASPNGRVVVRFMLLKGVDQRGFVFYTDRRSQKGRDITQNASAALAFYWDKIGRQVRVEGVVKRVPKAEVDAYWSSRPVESTISASISRQSAPLTSRATLLRAARELRQRFPDCRPPRPDYWIGFRLVPRKIEFWRRGPARLHHRELFVARGNRWRRTLLQP